jgi:hypothetical protein
VFEKLLRATDEYNKCIQIFLNADKNHNVDETKYATVNEYLRNRTITSEKALERARFALNGENDETKVRKQAENFKHYPILATDFLFSTRFRKISTSMKVNFDF